MTYDETRDTPRSRDTRAAAGELPDRWLVERPVAHRGLHGPAAPENSLAAFRCAVAYGLAVEFDVRLSRDAIAVVIHDKALARLTGVTGLVEQMPASDLGRLSLRGGPETVPTLKQALETIYGAVPVLIELKACSDPLGLARSVSRSLKPYRGAVAVQSFSLLILVLMRLLAPRVRRGLLSGLGPREDALSPFRANRALRVCARLLADFTFEGLGVVGLDRSRLEAARPRLRHPILLWTVKDEASAELALSTGCNLIFEGLDPADIEVRRASHMLG